VQFSVYVVIDLVADKVGGLSSSSVVAHDFCRK